MPKIWRIWRFGTSRTPKQRLAIEREVKVEEVHNMLHVIWSTIYEAIRKYLIRLHLFHYLSIYGN